LRRTNLKPPVEARKKALSPRGPIQQAGGLSEITVILQQIDFGDTDAAERILPLVYDELRKLAAAEAMRRILIENARRRRAVRHGGGLEKLSANATGFDLAAPAEDEELLLVHEALDALAAEDPRKAELVKQCYFVGLTLEEAAEVVGLPLRTAERHWAYARGRLAAEIERLRGL